MTMRKPVLTDIEMARFLAQIDLLADAVIALTARLAIQRSNQGKGGYVQFKEEWFDVHSDATPENDLA